LRVRSCGDDVTGLGCAAGEDPEEVGDEPAVADLAADRESFFAQRASGREPTAPRCRQGEPEVRHADALAISELTRDRAGLRADDLCPIELALERVDRAQRAERVREAPTVVCLARHLRALLEEASSVADLVPEERE